MQLEVRSKEVYVLSPLIYPHSLLAYTHRKGKKCLYCLCIYKCIYITILIDMNLIKDSEKHPPCHVLLIQY